MEKVDKYPCPEKICEKIISGKVLSKKILSINGAIVTFRSDIESCKDCKKQFSVYFSSVEFRRYVKEA